MVSIKDFQERALTGPLTDKRAFDKKLMLKVRELAKDYGITFNPREVIPDDSMADAVFKAGFDLLMDVGIYHIDTERVIMYNEKEVKDTMRTRPREITLGEGRDKVTFKSRQVVPGDKSVPIIAGGSPHLATEDVYIPLMQSFAQEPTNNGLCPGVVTSAYGIENRARTPGEIICAMAEARWMKEAARRAGKPGIYIDEPMSATSPAAYISAFSQPGGYKKETTQMSTHLYGEMKIPWERVVLATYALQNGIVPWTCCPAVIGAYCRNAEEATIVNVASTLAQLEYNRGSLVALYTVNVRGGNYVYPRDNYMEYATFNRTMRNIPVPVQDLFLAGAGPCTEMVVYELVAQTIAYTASGGAAFLEIHGGGVDDFKRGRLGVGTGMEARIAGETAHAVASMSLTRSDANELVNMVIKRYEDDLIKDKYPTGKTFTECYDLKTLTPSKEYLDIYAEAKRELTDIGIKYE